MVRDLLLAMSSMSNLLRSPVLLVALACASCGGDPGEESPGLVIEAPGEARSYFHAFGEVPRGDIVEHIFRLRNLETAPIVLLDVQGACSCTSVKRIRAVLPDGSTIDGDPRKTDGMLELPPGALAEMTIHLDSAKAAPNHNELKVMRLRTSSTRTPYLTFEISFFARQLFQATPATLDLEDVPQGAGKSGTVDIVTGVRGSPARVLGIAKQGKLVHAELAETVSLDETLWVLTIQFPENQPLGAVRDQVVLSTTDADGAGDAGTLAVDVWARVVPDIVIYPQQINLESIAPDTTKQVPAELRALTPGLRTKILAARIDGDSAAHLSVTYDPVTPDSLGRSATWKLELSITPGLPPGRIQATLVITLEDSQFPEVTAPLVGFVR
jgi:hypothetical protein